MQFTGVNLKTSLTAHFGERRSKILAACEKHWPAYKDDCSGFLKAVFKELGTTATLPNVAANDLYDYFKQQKSDWFYVGTGQNATSLAGACAHEGDLVVAAWKNPDGEKHGHLAIVTEYMSTAKASKPEQRLLSYWGSYGSEGKKGERITLSFSATKLNDTSYFVYQGAG